MLCIRCNKDIPQNREVKLKNGLIACSECAEIIFKEYHKERYRKYLRGKINYEDLDPPGGGPTDAKFLEVVCGHCFKSLAKNPPKKHMENLPLLPTINVRVKNVPIAKK